MAKRQSIGKWGEQTAENYLRAQGYHIISRNVRTPYGEIDLIANLTHGENQTIIFVEVKTRTTTLFGPPEAAVDAKKKSHLLPSIQHYMQENPSNADWRIDVIAIENFYSGEEPIITHFENAITDF